MLETSTRPVDLHVHSTASDGTMAPAVLVEMADRVGLAAIALTDHDTVEGMDELVEAARGVSLEVIPGVELGAANDPERGLIEVHILGYFIDYRDCALGEALGALHRSKVAWLGDQLEAIAKGCGIRLSLDQVHASNPGADVLRRPHIWKTIEELHPGEIERERYYRRTDFGGDMYMGKSAKITLEESIALVRGAGGVPVLAHPGYSRAIEPRRLIEICHEAGVAGVEVAYPYFWEESGKVGSEDMALMKVARESAEALGMLQTGGSDYHGEPVKTVPLGAVPVDYTCVEALLAWKHRHGG